MIALAAANQARVRPHSRRVAASRRVCARPPVAAPRGYPCAHAPIWRRVDFVLALLRERRFRHVFALQRQCLEFVRSIGISRGVISCLHTALSFAKGANASSLAAEALSASPAGSTAAVPSARASAAPATGNDPPRTCVSTFGGSTSTLSTMAAARRGSGSSWNTGAIFARGDIEW